ncbi:MAG: hypothetical protein V3S51_06880 [Dehalococcoidia bacterium]
MSALLLSISFALSTGALLLFLGLFLDFLHERRESRSNQQLSS